jgi:ribosomal protein S18 acetylase RimI-like enzyme
LRDADLLALFDEQMRRQAVPDDADLRIERRAAVTRALGPGAGPEDNCILWSGLNEASAEAAILAERARPEAAGRALEWKVYGHDRPADLGARLERHGFVPDEPETLMAFDLADALPAAPAVAVRRIAGASELESVRAIKEAVWGVDMSASIATLARTLAERPGWLSIYVAEDEAQRAGSTAWLRKPPGVAFASLWGGATLPAFRGRGFYRALVAARLREAREAGYAYVTVDARETSRPILERLGFRALTTIRGYVLDLR